MNFRRSLTFLYNIINNICREKMGRARSERGGTRWPTGGEVKGKLANGVGSQYSHAASERGVSNITQADAHTSAAISRLNWSPHRFKWTRPFRGKTKSGFCPCAITFRTSYTLICSSEHCLHLQGKYSETYLNLTWHVFHYILSSFSRIHLTFVFVYIYAVTTQKVGNSLRCI